MNVIEDGKFDYLICYDANSDVHMITVSNGRKTVGDARKGLSLIGVRSTIFQLMLRLFEEQDAAIEAAAAKK